jgi:hypothetical protein
MQSILTKIMGSHRTQSSLVMLEEAMAENFDAKKMTP